VSVLIDPDDIGLDGISVAALRSGHRFVFAGKVMGGPHGHRSDKVTHPYYPSGNPRFNHVAMSVPADLLGETFAW